MSKDFDSYNDLLMDLYNAKYSDEVIGDFTGIDPDVLKLDYKFENLVYHIVDYTANHLPGYKNPSYPNCISLNVNAYGFNYVKDRIGLGISTALNKKTGDITYTLTFNFGQDVSLLKFNQVYNYASENGYIATETPRKKK
jgi:hypothetical protein